MSGRPAFRRHLAETRYGQLHLRTLGEGGTPLVLLHGSASASGSWTGLAPGLAGERLVVMPDRLGCGGSDRPPRQLSMAEYAEATLDALDTLGIGCFDVVGLHTGSCEAIELAVARPDRVRRVAVVEVPVFTAEEVTAFKARYLTHPAPAEDGSHLLWYWRWWTVGGFAGSAPRLRRWPLELVQEWAVEHLSQLPEFWWPYHAAIEYPTAGRVGAIRQPLLVLSTGDDLVEQTGRARELLPPQAEIAALPGFDDVTCFFAWMPDDAAAVLARLRLFLA